jgi:hypothetical protein
MFLSIHQEPKMKFHAMAVAATLVFVGTAFAAPTAAPAPVSRNVTKVVRVKHHAEKNAMKHHANMRGVRRQRLDEVSAPESNSGGRAVRMDEALQKFRSNRG